MLGGNGRIAWKFGYLFLAGFLSVYLESFEQFFKENCPLKNLTSFLFL